MENKETLEKLAESYINEFYTDYAFKQLLKPIFIAGYQLAQQELYSEEEVLEILNRYNNHIQENFNPSKIILPIKEWFYKYKKK